MITKELLDKLVELGIVEGFGIRDGKIVLWENETEVPAELAEFIELDGQVTNGDDN